MTTPPIHDLGTITISTTTPPPRDARVQQAIAGGPDVAAVLIGYPNAEALLAQVPEDLRDLVAQDLTDPGALQAPLVQAGALDQRGASLEPTPEQRLLYLIERATRTRDNQRRTADDAARRAKVTTCAILQRPDPTTRLRQVNGREVRLSDLGALAIERVRQETLTEGELDRARTLVGLTPPAPTKKRRT